MPRQFKIFLITIFWVLGTLNFAGVGSAQDANTNPLPKSNKKSLTKLKRAFVKLQLDFSKIKKLIEDNKQLLNAQQEKTNLRLNALVKQNKALNKQIVALQKGQEGFDDLKEINQEIRVSLQRLDLLIQSLLLSGIGEVELVEPLLLELLEDPSPEISKDLLLLHLAQLKRQQGDYENSLGYFSSLIANFEKSPYLPQAIFAMGEIFGALEQVEEQEILFTQLLELPKDHGIRRKAEEQLKRLGIQLDDDPTSDVSSDTAPNVSSDTAPNVSSDTTRDTSADAS